MRASARVSWSATWAVPGCLPSETELLRVVGDCQAGSTRQRSWVGWAGAHDRLIGHDLGLCQPSRGQELADSGQALVAFTPRNR